MQWVLSLSRTAFLRNAICSALLTLATIGMGHADSGLPPELARKSAMNVLAHLSDDDLAEQREICARHQMPALKRRLEAEGVPVPGTVEYRTRAIEVAAERKTGAHLYTQYDPGNGFETLKAIVAAAGANRSHFTTPGGRREALTCPLAYDAGNVFGFLRPGGSGRAGARRYA